MSSPWPPPFIPFIALADKCARALRNDMVVNGHKAGFTDITQAHNAIFASLPSDGARAADMAIRAGITRQSMGELIRDMTRMGVLETIPDPDDGRAKIVRFTDYGMTVAQAGRNRIIELEEICRAEFGAEDWETTRKVLARVREMLEPEGPIDPAQVRTPYAG